MPVDQSRIDALTAGELDWADAIPLQQVTSLSKDARFTYASSPVAGIPDFVSMNTKIAPFDNPKVRQAMALAVSLADVRDVAYLGTGELGLTEMPTGSAWYDATGVFAAEQNVAKAKQLLAEAGYPNGLTAEYLGLPQ
jgi:peptide/nickel transport system substrate-binding protein